MKTTRGAAALMVALAPVWLAGCGERGPGAWEGVARDSAGIEIVENTGRGAWGAGDAWTVQPDLTIGTAEGAAEYQFGSIVGVDVGADGRIYVMDQQASEVRVFDPEGRFLTRMGRAGSGPGELSQAAGPVFISAGDTVAVPDVMNQRISWYDTDGTPLGSHPLPMTEGIPARWMKTTDGYLIQQAMIMAFPGQAEVEPKNLLLRRHVSGPLADTLLEMPIGRTMDFGGGQPTITLFEAEPMWTTDPLGRLVFGNNSEYRLQVHGPDGTLERIVARPGPRQTLSEADQNDFRRVIQEAWGRAGMPPEAREAMSSALRFARYYPAYANLLGGPDGTIWVQSVQTPETAKQQGGTFDVQDYGGPRWDVFDADGRFLGAVDMPPRFMPLMFQGEHVFGVQRDDLDVQYVARLSLQRPARADS